MIKLPVEHLIVAVKAVETLAARLSDPTTSDADRLQASALILVLAVANGAKLPTLEPANG
jgi:hypothetical protein